MFENMKSFKNYLAIVLIFVLGSCGKDEPTEEIIVTEPLKINIPLSIPNGSYESTMEPQSGLFFKNKRADNIFVFDIRADDTPARMIARAAQGIINQEVASVYLYSRDHHMDQINDTKLNYTVVPRSSINVKYGGLGALLQKFPDRFKKIVVYDPTKDYTWCIALMIAGQQSAIPVTPEIKDFLVNQLRWNKEIYDIRNLWPDKQTAYQWAIDNLSANAHKKISFSAGGDMWLYDYATASKGFVFWLNTRVSTDATILENICTKMNYQPGSSAFGYGNGDGDDLNKITNKHNVGFVVSDFYANGSFWCSYPNKSFSQRQGQAIKAEPGKVYVSLMWSDGDNIQFDANALYRMFKSAKRRGEIPVGLTIAPALQELNPFLLEYFYQNRTPNDELVAGPSGVQFIYGDYYNAAGYSSWLALNKAWLETGGFHTAVLWDATRIERFNEYMSTCGLQGVFDQRNRAADRYIDGVVAVDKGVVCWNEGDVFKDIVANGKPSSIKPVFHNVYIINQTYNEDGNVGYEKLMREIERLEAKYPKTYVYLLPMDLCATLKKYYDEK